MRFIKTILALTEQVVKLAVLYAELASRVSALEAGKPAGVPEKSGENEAEKKFQAGLESILNYTVRNPAGVTNEENE